MLEVCIKTTDGWWVDGSGYGLTKIKKERLVTTKTHAQEYIKGTNIWGNLKISKIKLKNKDTV